MGEVLLRVRKVLSEGVSPLAESLSQTEAEQLVLHALNPVGSSNQPMRWSRFELLTHLKEEFPSAALPLLLSQAERRASGYPLQYLTGVQVFVDHEYEVTPDVLIPRPETEILFSTLLTQLKKNQPPHLGVEVGLGSGVLSVEILSHFPALRMVATEISAKARAVGSRNAMRILGARSNSLEILPVKNSHEVLEPVRKHLLGERADFIVSNPPYLAGQDETEIGVSKFEPHQALFPSLPLDPNYFYRMMATEALQILKPGGFLFLEIPHERAQAIFGLFKTNLCWDVQILLDLTGRERVIIAQVTSSE